MASGRNDYSKISMSWFLGDEGEPMDHEVDPKKRRVKEFEPMRARLMLEYLMIGLTERQACAQVPLDFGYWKSWKRGAHLAPDVFVEAMNLALDEQAETFAEDIIDISDGTDARTQKLIDEALEKIDNPLGDALSSTMEKHIKKASFNSSQRIHTRQWIASKRLSKKYGDKMQLDHGNAGGKAFQTQNFKDLTTEQLEALAEADAKLQNSKK